MELKEAKKLNHDLRHKIKGLITTGSIIRNHPQINDLDFLTYRDLNDVLKDFENLANIQLIRNGHKIKSFIFNDLIKIDIWKIPFKNAESFMKLHFNLGKGIIVLKNKAKELGLKLSQYGLYDTQDQNKRIEGLKTEHEIIEYLNSFF